MANVTETQMPTGFHCIDLSNPDINHSIALLKEACMDSGIFYVINHGISKELMDEVFGQSKKYFELPLNEKKKFVWKNRQGYRPISQEIVDSETYEIGEAFYVRVKASENDLDAKKPSHGRNVLWPPADMLPGWKETMQKYHRETLEVGRALLRLIALALDLNLDFFNQEMLARATASVCGYFHYQVDQVIDPSKEKLGSRPHCDCSLITLLASDDVVGLQICRDKSVKPRLWEHVPPLKGAFIVNIGNFLERLSNDAFKSTLHRVSYSNERYSIGVFVIPNEDCLIECLPNWKSDANPAKYPTTTCEEILRACVKEDIAAAARIKTGA